MITAAITAVDSEYSEDGKIKQFKDSVKRYDNDNGFYD